MRISEGPVDPATGSRPGKLEYSYQGQISGDLIGDLKRVTGISASGSQALDITRNFLGRPTSITYYTDGGPLATYTNIFDSSGRFLQKVIGPRGEKVRGYGYHPVITNLLTSVTNAVNEVIRYTHDTNGLVLKVTSITFPGGMVRTNIYYSSGASKGFLQMQADIGFRTNYFTYDKGNVILRTNELGLVTSNSWDNLNRLLCTTLPDTTTISNQYDKLDIVGVKDRLNQWTRYGYNTVRQLMAVTNANSQITQFSYCGCGAPDQVTRWNGAASLISHFNHDIAGRLTNAIYPDGYQLNYAYDTLNLLQTVTDSAGYQLYLSYAKFGLNHKIQSANLGGQYLLVNQFDEYGRVIQNRDRNFVLTTNAYDFIGRLVARRLGDAYVDTGVENFVYDARGLLRHTNELGFVTKFARDTAGRLLYQTNANNELLQFTYDPADDLRTLTDGKSQTTSWKYDREGRVTNKVDAAANVLFTYKYDANSRLTNRWSNAKGNTFYIYDAVGNLKTINYPLSPAINFSYDGVNRLTNMLDAIGTTAFTWTDGSQLAGEDGPWTMDTVSYTYINRLRSRLGLAQPNASAWIQDYGYDAQMRLSTLASPAGQFVLTYLLTGFPSTAFASDRVAEVQLPGYEQLGYRIFNEYDSLMRVKSTWLFALNEIPIHRYSYDAGSQRTQQVFPAGNTVDYTYDKIGQLKTAKGKENNGTTPRVQEQFGYEYDAAWNLSRRTNNAMVQTFNVDSRNQLTTGTRSGTFTVAGHATLPGASIDHVTVSGTGLSSGNAEVYADGSWAKTNATLANGNNTYTATATDTTWPTARTAQDSVTVNLPSTATFVYDLNGNLRTNNTRIFDYDDENQLIRVTEPSAWKSEFSYDGMMRRRVRTECVWSGSSWLTNAIIRYVYDGMLAIQERDANNLPQVSYTRGIDLSGTRQGAGGIGGLLARTRNPELGTGNSADAHSYYHCDGNGNITCMVNTNGIVVARYNYDPYGNILGMSGPLAEANTYRFSSKEFHAASGLCYYGYRFYAPSLQRWLNSDPLGDIGSLAVRTAGIAPWSDSDDGDKSTDGEIGVEPLSVWAQNTLNLHRMTGNNPVNQIDLLGLASCKIDGERVTVHKNDVDPWPSQPHGHIYDKNQVVDTEGRLFNKTTRQVVGRFSRSGLARWRAFLGRLNAIIAPVIGIIENLGADAERAKRANENGKTIEQQRREDLRNQPTIPGFFGEPLPNPYYCPMAMEFPVDRGMTNTLLLAIVQDVLPKPARSSIVEPQLVIRNAAYVAR